MLDTLKDLLLKTGALGAAETAEAHCDGPCGVYDPASIRIAAEAVVSMTKKMLDLKMPDAGDGAAMASYINTMSRYISIKEEQATLAKKELLVLWTDYFKPNHLEQFPNLHDTFWKAAKLCSACKYEVSLQHCEELMAACKEIHDIFWASKNREVPYYLAS
jgi:nickel superoxide dismutase